MAAVRRTAASAAARTAAARTALAAHARGLHATSAARLAPSLPLRAGDPGRDADVHRPESEIALLKQLDMLGSPTLYGKLVSSVSSNGFTVADLAVIGPGIVLNNAVLLWDVPQYGVGGPDSLTAESSAATPEFSDPTSPFHGWTTEMFKIFEVVEPTPDILIIGSGATTSPLPPKIKAYLMSLGMQSEVQASRQAAHTYNMLLQEGRRPSIAMLPLIPTSARTGEELVKTFTRDPAIKRGNEGENKDASSEA
ncbi:NADH dehydrogenase [ubiquinone] 1 alpha subcomplex assembly factor 3 [Polyrhizophydium stewartii]|uniref:NADH dehydrogenase [ubiquinone] 1 alpha subcomplex assembly factor 3 n=1 Tax=Polyrhizophydium stewartii TaxID=2732419 RepID=A0ABR4MYK7_9FUNG